MSSVPDDEITVPKRPHRRRSERRYNWVLTHLAKFPGRVATSTFVAGVVVTIIVIGYDGDRSPTTIVSLIATLWALFFSVMIYLLTAKDTDKVLEQIADLHDQLATALASPDGDEDTAGEEVTDDAATGGKDTQAGDTAGANNDQLTKPTDTSSPHPPPPTQPAASGTTKPQTPPAHPVTMPPAPDTGQQRRGPGRQAGGPGRQGDGPGGNGKQDRPGRQPQRQRVETRGDQGRDRRRGGGPRVLVGTEAVTEGLPPALLEAWISATGLTAADITRAWTRDPRSDRQWVLETADERWVVFAKDTQRVGVISLNQMGHGGGRGRQPMWHMQPPPSQPQPQSPLPQSPQPPNRPAQ